MTESKKENKIIFGILAFLIMVSIVAVFYRYVVLKDFEIFTDPEAFNESLLEE